MRNVAATVRNRPMERNDADRVKTSDVAATAPNTGDMGDLWMDFLNGAPEGLDEILQEMTAPSPWPDPASLHRHH